MAMPIIAVLTAKMDNRWLISVGFVVFAVVGLWIGEVTWPSRSGRSSWRLS